MEFGPKTVELLPDRFKTPIKLYKWWCFLTSGLFFSPFSSSQEKGGKKPLTFFYLAPPSTNNYHSISLKKGMVTILFYKPCLLTKAPESDKMFEPLSESLVCGNPLNPLFLLNDMMWTTYWPNNVKHLLTLMTEKCGPLISPTAHTHTYIYIYIYVSRHPDSGTALFPFSRGLVDRAKVNDWTALPFVSGNTQILGAKLLALSLCSLRN